MALVLLFRGRYGGPAGAHAPTRNLITYSEPLLANLTNKSAAVTQANFTELGLTNGIQIPAAAQLDFAYQQPVMAGPMVISMYVVMADNSRPVVDPTGGSGPGDFTLLIGNAYGQLPSVNLISGAVYRVAGIADPFGGVNCGVVRFAAHSGKAFRVSGWQLEAGSQVHAYKKVP